MRTRENERALIREQASVDSAGEIAVALSTFHDSLNGLMWDAAKLAPDDDILIDSPMAQALWPTMTDLSNKVTVHESLLPQELEGQVDNVIRSMHEVFDVTPRSSVRKARLRDLRKTMRSVTDDLQAFRSKAYLK